jgi:N-methylhydantoinase B
MRLDSVELEVMSRKLASISDEMYFAVQRAARSSYVKEAADFATALLDPAGDVFAYPPSATFAFLIDTNFRGTIDAVPNLAPGDVIITNDPYTSHGLSTHLPDLHLLMPYFADGKIVAYGWSFVHCSDIGGSVPGSISPVLTSIFQEGFRIPPIKLVKAGVLNDEFLSILRVNSRMPEVVIGDVKAMLGALETGHRRLADLIAKQGVERLLAAQRDLQDDSEQKARAVLRRIPDGDYTAWDYLDDDAVTGIPVRVRVCLRVRDGAVEIDTSGSDPQVASAANVPSMGLRMYWLSFRLTTVLTTLDPMMAHNSGMYRAISAVIPRGSILNAEYPDAVGVRAVAPRRLFDCTGAALSQAVPDMLPAASGGVSVSVSFSELAPDGLSRTIEVLQPLRCGMGAFAGRDGVDGRDNSLNNMRNHPTETVEAQSSVRVLEYDLRPDSGGAGEWRGGVGQTMTFEVLCDGGIVLARGLDRMRFSAFGAAGGQPGATLRIVHNRGRADERVLGKIHQLHVRRGDIFTVLMPGGGGYGDPFRRAPDAVLADVVRGFVSAGRAASDYGVAIRGGVLDRDATDTLRRGTRPPAPALPVTYGAERRVWESVCDDAMMLAISERLYRLPKAIRQDARTRLFASAIGGIGAIDRPPLADLIGDPDAVRRDLRAGLNRL